MRRRGAPPAAPAAGGSDGNHAPPPPAVRPFEVPAAGPTWNLERFVPQASGPEGDPVVDYHTRLRDDDPNAELAQKTRVNWFQRATYSRARLFAACLKSPHIVPVATAAGLIDEWVDELELHAIGEDGWGGQRMTDVFAARRFLAPAGALVEEQVKKKRGWFRP